jgi:hypothetical protein
MGLVLAAAVTLSACGGGTEPTPLPSPTPVPPPVQETIVIYGDSGSVPAESAGYIDFTIPGAGLVEATVDWTFASSEVAIAMTTGPCDNPFAGGCTNIGPMNLTRSLKPKRVSGSVTQGGSARLWIVNLATVDESMAVQITLTRTRAASTPIVLQPFAWSWVPVPTAAVRAVRLQH